MFAVTLCYCSKMYDVYEPKAESSQIWKPVQKQSSLCHWTALQCCERDMTISNSYRWRGNRLKLWHCENRLRSCHLGLCERNSEFIIVENLKRDVEQDRSALFEVPNYQTCRIAPKVFLAISGYKVSVAHMAKQWAGTSWFVFLRYRRFYTGFS